MVTVVWLVESSWAFSPHIGDVEVRFQTFLEHVMSTSNLNPTENLSVYALLVLGVPPWYFPAAESQLLVSQVRNNSSFLRDLQSMRATIASSPSFFGQIGLTEALAAAMGILNTTAGTKIVVLSTVSGPRSASHFGQAVRAAREANIAFECISPSLAPAAHDMIKESYALNSNLASGWALTRRVAQSLFFMESVWQGTVRTDSESARADMEADFCKFDTSQRPGFLEALKRHPEIKFQVPPANVKGLVKAFSNLAPLVVWRLGKASEPLQAAVTNMVKKFTQGLQKPDMFVAKVESYYLILFTDLNQAPNQTVFLSGIAFRDNNNSSNAS